MDLKTIPIFKAMMSRMAWLTERQQVLAQNVANADTPNYKPRDLKAVNFHDLVAGASSGKLQVAATQPNHLVPAGASAAFRADVQRDVELSPSGNGVNIEDQMLKVPSPLSDDVEQLMHDTIGCCITVHRELGPGLFERIYSRAVCIELTAAGISFEREKRYQVRYRGELLSEQYLDFVIGNHIVLEIKSVDQLAPIHHRQILNYMRIAGLAAGLLMNFNIVVLPDGMSYRVLVLPEDVDQLTVPVLRKIRDLVSEGAIVIAPRPVRSPSLTGYPASDDEVRAIANDVWGAIDGKSITENHYGKGKIYWGKPVTEVLAGAKTPLDFEYNRPEFDTNLVWIHRRSADADFYFVANQKERAEDVKTSFRVDGKEAELWHPDTGMTEPAEYKIENGRTIVPLHLDPNGSVFVVFRHSASTPSRTLPQPTNTELATIQGPWHVSFPPHWGAPLSIRLDNLVSWTDSPDAGVKYFSGTATYTKDIEAPKEWFRLGAKIILDLGKVKEIAEVSVNGKPIDTILWKPPFQAEVTGVLTPGANHLEIKITNLWPNRMIGDQQPGVQKRYTFTDYKPYKADSPLLESGLFGPVKLEQVIAK